MHDDSLEGKIQGALTRLGGNAAPELRARAVAAMAAAPPAPRPRHRLIAIASVAAAALFGLGFVPIPLGSAKGALDRAVASAMNARTVHITTWMRTLNHINGRTEESEETSEEWLAEGGFQRRESRSEGRPIALRLIVGPWETTYDYETRGRPGDARERFYPCMLHPADMPDRAQFQRRFELFQFVADFRHQQAPQVQFREYREGSLWGGEVEVIEAEGVVEQGLYYPFSELPSEGDTIFVRAELDPSTDSLLSVREYKVNGNDRDLTYQATYEWNVEIPEDLKRFDIPEGTKVDRRTWWETRADKVIAQDTTRDWQVTLHAIDINRHGDILLSLSRVETPDTQMPSVYNSAPALEVQAVGSGGEPYEQLNGYSCYNARHSGYWTTTLKPVNAAAQPRAITLTIRPYPRDPCRDQWVTFRNVPLPPRQDVDDVYAAAREVTQH